MHLVVDRVRRRLTLLRDGRIVFAASVGVGTPSAPTPAGEFYVRDRLTTLARSFYGPVAFGTSARSPVLTDWPGGGFVGIHGTSEPQLIPGAVSHGCIRLRNDDVLRLDRLLEIGTPLTIR
jgi:lipoprotein-anchoring transpeptidase ErfK/SrfK